ncbi:MAG: DNA polymerase III subunit beta [Candidatus Latescibacterota bacterium]
MKITTDQEALFSGLQTISTVVPPRATLPILSNVLLTAKDGRLVLSATDLDISILTRISVEVQQPGGITVPARKLLQIVRELPNTKLTLETEGERFSIHSDQGHYVLTGMPSDQFPNLPSDVEGVSVAVDTALMRTMIEKTNFAASGDETRPVLNGVLWRIENHDGSGRMTMVATDGHRLARIIAALSAPVGKHMEAILPPKVLHQLVRLISGGAALNKAIVGENFVVFDLETTVLFSRVIEGPYPEFEQVIPQKNEEKLVVAYDILVPGIRRVSILADSDTHQIRLALRENTLKLSSASRDIGAEAQEELPVTYHGKELEIAYDSSYLMDILRNMDSEEVVFELDTPVSAGVIRPVQQEEGQDYLCLIMPLHIRE